MFNKKKLQQQIHIHVADSKKMCHKYGMHYPAMCTKRISHSAKRTQVTQIFFYN